MAGRRGELAYRFYRVLTYAISPLIRLHLRWRRFCGKEHPFRWRERLGCPSAARPAGRLLWFHAVSLGEGVTAIPVIKRCLETSSDVNVLMTTTSASAFEVLKFKLPSSVIYQLAPLDIPSSIDRFLKYWRPDAIVLMEGEIWPNLIMGASRNGIALALLNARVSENSFKNWCHPLTFSLIELMLSKFCLILPLSNTQGIRFQLLQAPVSTIHYCGDLKCVLDRDYYDISKRDIGYFLEDIRSSQLMQRKLWMASSIHKGEEQVFLEAHNMLKHKYANLVTIIVPRQPHNGRDIALQLEKQGISVALRSREDKMTHGTSIYMVDSLGELRELYGLTPIAVIGGSFTPGSAGHNILEAAAAGCAIITGHHVGHFSHIISKMQRVNPLSVLQVSGEELGGVIAMLLDDTRIMEARRAAARQAYLVLSKGVVDNVWEMLHLRLSIFSEQQGKKPVDHQ